MSRWLFNLSKLVLMFVIPTAGWCEYRGVDGERHWFDSYAVTQAHGLWSEPTRSWIVAGALLAVAFFGVHLATLGKRWTVKSRSVIGLAVFLLALFFYFAFADAIVGPQMP